MINAGAVFDEDLHVVLGVAVGQSASANDKRSHASAFVTPLCRFWLGNEHAIRIAISPNRIDADMALLVQRVFDHLWGEDHAVPGQAEPIRLYRFARNGMAVLIVTTRPRIP